MKADDIDIMALASHLADSWQPDAEVRCEKGCSCIKAWVIPNTGQVLALVMQERRTSPQWRDQRGALVDSPYVAMYDGQPTDRTYLWTERPTTVSLLICDHAQKVPISVPNRVVWDLCTGDSLPLVVPIPAVRKLTQTEDAKRRARIAALGATFMTADTPE